MSVSARELDVLTLLETSRKMRKRLSRFQSDECVQVSSEAVSCDVLVTYSEVCRRHGTGTLLMNLFGENGNNICALRTHNSYQGEQRFGDWRFHVDLYGLSRPEIYRRVLNTLPEITPRRILSVPYHSQDIWMTLALKDAFGVPLCVYLMDDNCLFRQVDGVSRPLMEDLLEKADVRLAISREFTTEYERHFHRKFYTVPPLFAPEVLLQEERAVPSVASPRGLLIGNIWSAQQLSLLRKVCRESGRKLDWYCPNIGHLAWLKVEEDGLREDGIYLHPPLAESDLKEAAKKYLYTVVPSGTLVPGEDDAEPVARLSLPSRIVFLLAATQLPILVLGHPDTAAARFVIEHGVGLSCAYDPDAFEQILQHEFLPPAKQQRFRSHAHALAPRFSSEGMGEWIWKTLERGEPVDDRFEVLFAPAPGDPAPHVEGPVPQDLYAGFHEVYRSMRRLKKNGFCPDWMIDAGCSTGAWTGCAARIFPEVRYLLIDPLISEYDQWGNCLWHYQNELQIQTIEAAIGARSGTLTFNVSHDLYNSSFQDDRTGVQKQIEVPVIPLDSLLERPDLEGRIWVKLDLQFAEHLALEGGQALMKHVDVCFIELSLWKQVPDSCDLREMIDRFTQMGFRIYDECGGWRNHTTGRLFQMDLVFMREDLFVKGTPEERS